MFFDRADAGSKLGRALKAYAGRGVVVMAIPRGGAEVGYHVAKALKAVFSLLVVRKLPLPYNTEAGFGAIAETGDVYMQPEAKQWVSDSDVKRIKAEQRKEIKRRVAALRGGPLPVIKGRTVILVDDGIAMGSTIIAGIKACKKLGARKVIVASPVSSKEMADEVSRLCDELIVLETPDDFYAVAQVYYKWHDATDEEVIRFLRGP